MPHGEVSLKLVRIPSRKDNCSNPPETSLDAGHIFLLQPTDAAGTQKTTEFQATLQARRPLPPDLSYLQRVFSAHQSGLGAVSGHFGSAERTLHPARALFVQQRAASEVHLSSGGAGSSIVGMFEVFKNHFSKNLNVSVVLSRRGVLGASRFARCAERRSCSLQRDLVSLRRARDHADSVPCAVKTTARRW